MAVAEQARPEQQRTHLAQPWHCGGCRRTIGVIRGSTVEIRHLGRVITAQLPCAQTCDRCGYINVRDAQAAAHLTRHTQ